MTLSHFNACLTEIAQDFKKAKGKTFQLDSLKLENDIHKALVKVIKLYQKKKNNFIFFHIKNDVGVRYNKFFYDLNPKGVLPGTPDFCFLFPNGCIHFLEIKTLAGRLSNNQQKFIDQARSLGHKVDVAYGWSDCAHKAKKIINNYL